MLLNIFFSLLMLAFSSATSVENSNLTSSEYFGETTTTGVGYGKPTASCDGVGVCFVTSDGIFEMRDNFGKAKITFGKSGTVTRIHASAKSMTKNTIKKHFSGKHFIMEDPFKGTLEFNTGKKLDIYIPAGKHSMTKTKSGYLIKIKG